MAVEQELLQKIVSASTAGIKKSDLKKEYGSIDIDSVLEVLESDGTIVIDKKGSAYCCWTKESYFKNLISHDPKFRIMYDMLKSIESSINKNSNGLTNSVETLGNQINTLSNSLDVAYKSIESSINKNSNGLTNSVETLGNQINTLSNSLDVAYKSIESSINKNSNGLTNSVETLGNQINTLSNSLDVAYKSIESSINKNSNGLTNSVETLGNQINTLSNSLDVAYKSIESSINKNSNGLTNSVETLGNQINTLSLSLNEIIHKSDSIDSDYDSNSKMLSLQDFKQEFDSSLGANSSSIGWVELARIRTDLTEKLGVSDKEFYKNVEMLTNQFQDNYEFSSGGYEGLQIRGIIHGFVRCI